MSPVFLFLVRRSKEKGKLLPSPPPHPPPPLLVLRWGAEMMSSSAATVGVEKATSDLLSGPDWTLNMEICDAVNSNQWQPKDVVKAIKKRLQHKNPMVQYLALTLLETMIKNCGDFVHFQVAERDILQDMVKIAKKKTDMQVRDKILVLLDSWQEAFGGPQGKYPQYFWAYTDLKRSGIRFPPRSGDSAPIFTPPVAHPTPRPPVGYGMPNNTSVRLDEAMASEMGNLSLSDLDSIRQVTEVLSEMLQAINPNDKEAVKDEVIVDLVSQCRSNQKKIMQLVSSTGDEELLAQGLALNDEIQYIITKHDAISSGSPLPAISSGSPLPADTSRSDPSPSMAANQDTVTAESSVSRETPTPVAATTSQFEDDEEEEDGFTQLARRNTKNKVVAAQIQGDSPGTESASTSKTEGLPSASGNELVLAETPSSIKTGGKDQDIIDLLNLALVPTNASPPCTPPAPHTAAPNPPPLASNGVGSPPTTSPQQTQGISYGQQPFSTTQGYVPYNSYVAPWAQQTLPQPIPQLQPQSQPLAQPQPQYPQYSLSSSYPPPPWAVQPSNTGTGFNPTTSEYIPSQVAGSGGYHNASRPLQQQNSFNSVGNNPPSNSRPLLQQTSFGSRGNTLTAGSLPANKPFIPSYRLFEDLVDLKTADGRTKTSIDSPSLAGSSSQNTISSRKW